MIFSCNGSDLADALSKVTQALPQRKTSVILEGIKIKAEDNEVTLTATDLSFTIIKKIKADVKMSGEIIVPGKLFSEYTGKYRDGIVEISDIEENVKIKYLDNTTSLKTLNLNEYPVIKEYEFEYKITVKQKDFKDLILKTVFASSMNDENRPVLKGCLIKVDGDEIKSVALDGFRMAILNKKLNDSLPPKEMNVPSKDLIRICKLLENDEETVDLCFANKRLIVDLNDIKTISTPIEGFVRYESSIPRDYETEITVNTTLLKNALDRVSILSRYEKSNLVKLEVKNNTLVLFANSEMGDSSESISVISKGKDLTIGYNAKYIADCLDKIDDDYIIIKMNYNSPTIITAVENSEYLYLILPVRYH